jgi:hypothetical protein
VHIACHGYAPRASTPATKHPKAANKESFSADGYFPVQNGKADFSLTVTATFHRTAHHR